MIPIQSRTLLRVLRQRGPGEGRGAAFARRAAFLAAFPPYEVLNAAALAADTALFDFDEIPVPAPVFVIGAPRSGTTRLHRLLASDPRFTSFRLWQIMAPSLTAQLTVRGLAGADARLGSPLRRRLDALQDHLLGGADTIHATRLTAPEEDEALLMHAFASEFYATAFPVPGALLEYRRFDALPPERRDALMRYYRACVQRHLLIEGRHRTFLSKNPLFCHKVGSVRATFPGARFVVIVRNPAEAWSSLASLLARMRDAVGADARDEEEILAFVVDCYRNALAAADSGAPGSTHVTRYEDLVASPRAAVEAIYSRFGIPMEPAYAAMLDTEEDEARTYRSAHRHAPSRLDEARIEERAAFVYERFGYPRRAP